ncbi:hypothetical protein BWI93_27030 [Siphonobacter sp. BAB-5385]|uniref:Lipoprotein n=1 Tax=Siphonobacter curvatus TaxID=2094562 RepID=A0A2S7IHL6_9BACT|nr:MULTISPECIES: hypothetical protein [Siphonobacter]OZI05134.1 hypothetical protein BWI93_27030 [Siphonobacter sp. BAB-5385]PQA55501.1 hypothetical protein C5O19_18945 [Siphonobacter curvatus]
MRSIFALAALTLLAACDSPDVKPRNDDNTLTAVWVNVPGADENSARYNGVFNAAGDTVRVTVPQKTATGLAINLQELKLRGSIPSDAEARPAMGLMNMSQPFKIDIISGRQNVRSYWIVVTQSK